MPVFTDDHQGGMMSNSTMASISKQLSPRRSFIKQVLATGAAVTASGTFAGRTADLSERSLDAI